MTEQTVLDDYLDFIKSRIHIEKVNNGYYNVNLPLFDHIGDGISIHVKELGNTLIELSDDGYCDSEIYLRKKRKQQPSYYTKLGIKFRNRAHLSVNLKCDCNKEELGKALYEFSNKMLDILHSL